MLSREQDAGGDTKYYDYSAGGEREGQAIAREGTAPTPPLSNPRPLPSSPRRPRGPSRPPHPRNRYAFVVGNPVANIDFDR